MTRVPKNTEEITQILKNVGLKATQQRITVYKALDKMGHTSAEAVTTLVREKDPKITVASVYRILDSFANENIISRLSTPSGKMHYDITPTVHHHVYHKDGTITDLEDQKLAEIIENYFAEKNINGQKISEVRLQVFMQ